MIKEKTITALEDMITLVSRDDVIVIGADKQKQHTRGAGKIGPKNTGIHRFMVDLYIAGDCELDVIQKQEIEDRVETVIENS
jgi:hypothetical protein